MPSSLSLKLWQSSKEWFSALSTVVCLASYVSAIEAADADYLSCFRHGADDAAQKGKDEVKEPIN